MRKFLAFLTITLLAAGSAWAGSNIVQQDDGSTVWRDQNSVDVPVGDSGLVVRITDLATAATFYVVSHKPGNIKKAYVVREGAASSNSNASTLTISIADGSTAYFTPISAGATITTVTTTAGFTASVEPAAVNTAVGQGNVIAVYTNGGETCDAVGCMANVTIVIE